MKSCPAAHMHTRFHSGVHTHAHKTKTRAFVSLHNSLMAWTDFRVSGSSCIMQKEGFVNSFACFCVFVLFLGVRTCTCQTERVCADRANSSSEIQPLKRRIREQSNLSTALSRKGDARVQSDCPGLSGSGSE